MGEMIERFRRFVDRRGEDECWPWTGRVNSGGYGEFRDVKMRKAHRVAYELYVGPIPDGEVVRHKCDNPSCVNPRHLIPGTQKQNVRDRYVRGRDFHHRGEDHGKSKLSRGQVISIRLEAAAGTPQREIDARYGISQFGVRYAIRGWRHV